ncbi:hypothetical protein [Georgenia sp. H159]|uniref:hypothetical protein n=1 Tax=Georgenia sp. H159 TaxID=3076115 RepID=UPI002D794798|nr:hypothetical protein [Georgenia sp. H159]
MLVAVQGTTTATLPPRSDGSTSFPVVTADDVAAEDLSATVVRVRQGSTEVAPDGAVAVRWVPALPAVALDLTDDGLARAAEYEVVVALTHTDGRRQLLTFTLTRADGELAVPTTTELTVTRGVSVLGTQVLEQKVDGPTRLPAVVGADTRLTELRARQLEAGDPVVQLGVGPDVLPAGPGTELDLSVTVDAAAGKVGEVTRTVELVSPQLTDPTTVTITVLTRRHPVFLGAALVLGALLGTLVRVLLPRWTAALATQRARADLLLQLDALRAASEDTTFREDITAIRVALAAARGRSRIDTAVAAAARDAQLRVTALDEALRGHSATLAALRSAARRRPALPAELEQPLARLSAALDVAGTSLERRDATSAGEHLRSSAEEAGRLLDAASTWTADVRSALADATTAVGQPTADGAGALRARLDGLAGRLPPESAEASPPTEPDAVATQLDAVLTALDRAGGYAALNLPVAVTRLADDVRDAADTLESVEPAVATTLRTAADRFSDSLPPVGRDLRRHLDDLTERFSTLRDVLVDELGRGLPTDRRDPVTAAVSRGEVVTAALLRAQALATPTTTRLGTAASTGPVTAGTVAVPTEQEPAETPPVLAQAPVTFGALIRTLPRRTLIGAAGMLLGLTHVVLALVLVLLTGYALFLPDWQGHYADLFQAFTWAFAVDLTITGLRALVTVGKDGTAPAAQAA